MYTLCQVAASLDGVPANVDAKTVDNILELLDSPNPDIHKWTCLLVGRLAGHDSTALAVLDLKPCLQLVTLLHFLIQISDEHPEVIAAATFTLSQIACWLDGSQVREPLMHASAIYALCAISERPDGIAALAYLDVSEKLQTLNRSVDVETQARIDTIHNNLARYIKGSGIAV
ncbi:hypothetical protein B0H19DRAFT_1082036 [Mycena capillaripes]|nr:hypothetical protein B0H19DRAFT_1082036 [Mycena capillaripes]